MKNGPARVAVCILGLATMDCAMGENDDAQAQESKSRNPLELLAHDPIGTLSTTFAPSPPLGTLATVQLPVDRMTVRNVTLANQTDSRTVNYYDVVARMNPARDEHVQFGIYLDAGQIDSMTWTFPLRIGLEPQSFVPDRVELEDDAGTIYILR